MLILAWGGSASPRSLPLCILVPSFDAVLEAFLVGRFNARLVQSCRSARTISRNIGNHSCAGTPVATCDRCVCPDNFSSSERGGCFVARRAQRQLRPTASSLRAREYSYSRRLSSLASRPKCIAVIAV